MKNDDLDNFISSNLQKFEVETPPEVKSNVRRRIAALADQTRRSTWRKIKIWVPLLAAAMLILAISLPLLFPPRPELKKISQIRTEFSIPGKNIRILWVQRADFYLGGTVK